MKQMKSFIAFTTIIAILLSLIVVVPSVSASAENLALNCQVTATSQLGTYDKTRVIDGKTSFDAEGGKTAITSFDSTGYGYFELSFSEETTVNFVKLYFNQTEANQRPKDIAVDVKRKDGVYVRVAEMHDIDYDIVSANNDKLGRNNQFDFIFEEIECVSVRVTGNRQRTRDVNNSQSSNYNFRLMEIELFNKSDVTEEDYTGTAADLEAKYNIPVPEPVLDNLFRGMEVSSPLQLSNYSVSRLTNGYKSLTSDCSITSFNTANISYSEILLNEETELNQVRLYFSQYEPKQRPKDIAIDVRLKNGVYVRVAEMHNIDYNITSSTASVNVLDFKFEKLKGVAVRISGNRQRTRDFYSEPTASYNFRLVEVEGYLNPTVVEEDYTGATADTEEKYNIAVPDPILENLALNQTIIANKELNTYYASKLNDGNKGYSADASTNAITQWNTAKTAYFEVQFQETTKINRVGLFLTQWEKNYLPKDLVVDVQMVNGVYVRVAEMHNIDYSGKESLTFSFEEVEAVSFRVTGNCARNESSENFRLMELEAYYYPDMPAEFITGTTKDENDLYNVPVPDPVLDNVAAGKKVTANETLKVQDVTYDANFLTDGNSNYFAGTEKNAITNWNKSTKMGYFEVELGEKISINRIKVFLTKWQREYLPLDIAIDVRLESGVYVRVAEMHNIDYSGKESLTFSFEEVEAVSFRVTGNCARNESSENFRLMELEAYYYPDMPAEFITGTTKDENDLYNVPVPDPVLDNVAAGKKVTANETLKVQDVTYDANFLTDGNSNYFAGTEKNAITNWNKSTKMGYFEVELGEKISINRIKVFLTKWQREYLPLDIAIDVRLESGVYVRVAEMHNIDYSGKESLTFSFEEVEAVSFRVTGNCARNESSGNFRLMELEAYYYPDMPAEFITGTTKDAEEKYNIPVPDSVLINYVGGLATYEITFDGVKVVNQVKLCLSQYEKEKLPVDMAVYAKVNEKWVRVAEKHNISYDGVTSLTFTFAQVNATAIKVKATKATNTASDNFRLVEIQTYYNPNVTNADYDEISVADVNEDVLVNTTDLIITKRTLLGIDSSYEIDLNNDGRADVLDYIVMYKAIVG